TGRRLLSEWLDERVQRRVSPVNVLENGDQGVDKADGFDELETGREGLLPLHRGAGVSPYERRQANVEPRPFGRLRHQAGEQLGELLVAVGGRVGVENTRLSLHDLAESPERDAVAVREAPTATPLHGGLGGQPRERGTEFGHQAA